MQNVIIGCKHHQHQDQTQPDSEPHFLGPLRQRTSPNGFHRIEQKVTSIEQGNREQVQQSDGDRQHRSQMNQQGSSTSGGVGNNQALGGFGAGGGGGNQAFR